jgi:hypothetical protein
MIKKLVNTQGTKAKNRFQFKKRNPAVPVYRHLNTEEQKQNRVNKPMKIVSWSLFVSFRIFIMLFITG